MKISFFTACALALCLTAEAQPACLRWDAPGAGNPFIPGYFADPTIKKFGDTYYLYATTDGNGNGYGPAQVWLSRDFRNWTNLTMPWPSTEVVWAPDVMQAPDGTFHYFYCEPCMLHEGVGKTPRGPWTNILGESDAVLVPDRFVHNAITLDGQTFVDDDGSVYLYFGTWGIYDGFGCGVARLGSDMKSFTDKKLIPNTEIKDFFEAPFVLKKDGIYYFMYSSGSCHDHTYRVQYATSTVGPMGPYQYQGCILETNADQTVHGPGHHSVLKDGDDYYIVYHRHNNPKSIHGFHRQICIDRLVFSNGKIEKVEPTHEGLLPKSVAKMPVEKNLAFGAKVTASSVYSDWFRADYATDDNNATLWKPATATGEDFITIDLGTPTLFREVWTQFEYATYFYQYKIETSSDGSSWQLYADKTGNTQAASPSVDRGQATARYIRITVTGRQKNGHFGGIWNVKVFDKGPQVPPQLQIAVEGNGRWRNTAGMLGGTFEAKNGQRVLSADAAFLFQKGQPYSVVYQQNGHTEAFISDGKTQRHFTDGTDMGKSRRRFAAPFAVDESVKNLRVYSYALQPAEIAYCAEHPVEQAKADVSPEMRAERKAANHQVVNISADDYAVGTSLSTIANRVGGAFHGENALQVELCQGRQAFHFTGNQTFVSDFGMPQSLAYSAPYTVSAWIMNPEVATNECVAQLMPVRNDLSTVELCNGSDPQNGLVMHNGSFENSGAPEIIAHQGEWQHWAITYDGYMERHYLNGRLVSEKNMMLLLRPQASMQIGASFDGSNAFDGYLHALRVYDRTLSADEISREAAQPSATDVCLLLQDHDGNAFENQGLWGGTAEAEAVPFNGKMAYTTAVNISQLHAETLAGTLQLAFALDKNVKKGTLISGDGLQIAVANGAIVCNGASQKVKFMPWNLLVLTANGKAFFNGAPLEISCDMPHAWGENLVVGGKGVAVHKLLITKSVANEKEMAAAWQTLSKPEEGLTPALSASLVTPKLARLTLTGQLSAQCVYQFDKQSGFSRETSALVPVSGTGRKSFTVLVKDAAGNVGQSQEAVLNVTADALQGAEDDFSGTALSGDWHQLSGEKATEIRASVADGQLTLQSANGNFNANSSDNGLLVYREVTGDFLMQGKVTALTGSDRHATPAYNEGGLMVLDDSEADNQKIVQLGVFPSYNCGNMLTTISHHGMRPQFPRSNGWNYDPWMQIERHGDLIYVRTSPDGVTWTDMPSSPIEMHFKGDKPLKVGFFQVTYTDKTAAVTFDDFSLFTPKKAQ